MEQLVQYFLMQGMDPASAATMAAKLMGAQMRPPEFDIGQPTVTPGDQPDAYVGRTLHAFGLPVHEASMAAGQSAYRNAPTPSGLTVDESYIIFLQDRYGMSPEHARHFADWSLASNRKIDQQVDRFAGQEGMGGFAAAPVKEFGRDFPEDDRAGSAARGAAIKDFRRNPTFGGK